MEWLLINLLKHIIKLTKNEVTSLILEKRMSLCISKDKGLTFNHSSTWKLFQHFKYKNLHQFLYGLVDLKKPALQNFKIKQKNKEFVCNFKRKIKWYVHSNDKWWAIAPSFIPSCKKYSFLNKTLVRNTPFICSHKKLHH